MPGYKLARKLCLAALADDVERAEQFRGYWGDVRYTAGILEALELWASGKSDIPPAFLGAKRGTEHLPRPDLIEVPIDGDLDRLAAINGEPEMVRTAFGGAEPELSVVLQKTPKT
jgi:hypothetical protein